MANTKSSDIRFQVLDRCLKREALSTEELREAVNRELEARGFPLITSSNTVRNDISHMVSNHDVEVEEVRVGRTVKYRYADRNMSIYKVSLNDNDLIQLLQGISILSRFDGLPQLGSIKETLQRLQLSLDIQANAVPVVGFDDCARLQGRQFFSTLLKAITGKTVLEIEYCKYFDENSKKFIVSPCYLKEHSRRWFVLGMTPKYDNPMVLALDRIVSIRELPDQPFKEAVGFDFNDGFFNNIVGVTRDWNRQPEEIIIEVENIRLPYLLTKPIHSTQEVVEEREDSALLRLFVVPNVELCQILLSYGSYVRVLSPESVRDYMTQEIEFMCENYEELLDE